MSILVIYPSPDRTGGVCLLTPTGMLSPNETARRDLPAGTPYLLVNRASLPADQHFFEAWEADFSHPDGIAIGYEAWTQQHPNYFAQQ